MKQLLFIPLLIVGAASSQVERNIRIAPAGQVLLSAPGAAADPVLTGLQATPHQQGLFAEAKREIFSRKTARQNNPIRSGMRAGQAPVPALSTNFNGNTNSGTPNDNNVAVSNAGQVISVSNSNIRVYNDTGKLLLAKGLGFLASPQVGPLNRSYDPKCIYDPNHDRFILIFLNGTSSTDNDIVVCFTQTNDATGKWNCYRITGNRDNDTTWSDYPVVAINEEDLFVTVNKLKDGEGWKTGFRQSVVWQVRLKEGYDGDTLVSNYHKNIRYNGKSIWSICPIPAGSRPQGSSLYLLSVRPGDMQNDTVFIHYIDNSVSSGQATLSTKVAKTDRNYGLPPSAIQPPGTQVLETNDTRVLSGFLENGALQYVQTCVDTTTYNSAVFHAVIHNPAAANPVIKANLIKSDTLDIAYPSICYTGEGLTDHGAVITFSYVNQRVYPGTAAVYVNRDLSSYSDFVYCKAGEGWIDVLQDTAERWGDYTGIQRKYNEKGVCWLNGSWGDKNKATRTWIARLSSKDPQLNSPKAEQAALLNLFPNPVRQWLTLDFEWPVAEMLTFEVTDMAGKRMKQLYTDKASAGGNRFGFDASGWPAGNYLLIISNSKGNVATRQFSVN